ncbi:MAG: FkbM family methyltransferase [Dysgonamonadaceae bacterium]|jgi:FkbM family methyltransferase|nr:FkbM family methyltransferase [Dysgonamonadaceae bacterium]
MIHTIKRFLCKYVSLENYLRILQRSYFFAYHTGLLRTDSDYSYHYFVKKLIREGDVVIDIGANLGYYSLLFAQWVGDGGKVYAVEPVRIYNKIFNEKAKNYANIQLFPFALGSKEQTIDLVFSSPSGYLSSGLPHVYDSEKDGDIESQSYRFEAQMKIPSLLFNDLKKVDYIKCDIEGFEYLVLADLKDIIRRCKPVVQVEVWPENEENILHLFNDLGYFPYKLFRDELVLQTGKENRVHGDYIFLPSATPDSFLSLS